ncbi:MAG: hypothetical protein KatS3mg108_0410 [Isosphaeraceae bacterium]|jgi:predicted component of type VI protein secretion system|nr:MAG: hypothetical protein KatS3mg108_0410 [Isosphaeraceae bacterium]
MPARFVPLSSDGPPPISLSRPVLLVGRHPECDVRIDRPTISRRHCCLALVDGQVVLRDLGSRHGCWLNGRRIHEAHVELGDEIAIGPLIFRLEEGLPPIIAEGRGFPPVESTPPPLGPSDPLAAPPLEPLPPPVPTDTEEPLPPDLGNLQLGDIFKLRDE